MESPCGRLFSPGWLAVQTTAGATLMLHNNLPPIQCHRHVFAPCSQLGGAGGGAGSAPPASFWSQAGGAAATPGMSPGGSAAAGRGRSRQAHLSTRSAKANRMAECKSTITDPCPAPGGGGGRERSLEENPHNPITPYSLSPLFLPSLSTKDRAGHRERLSQIPGTRVGRSFDPHRHGLL